jgi:hypothetical protein
MVSLRVNDMICHFLLLNFYFLFFALFESSNPYLKRECKINNNNLYNTCVLFLVVLHL